MSYFNSDQQAYMDSLSLLPACAKCWCGWYRLGDCPHCPPDKTNADKQAVWCPECHNDPGPDGGEITHSINCSKPQQKDPQ